MLDDFRLRLVLVHDPELGSLTVPINHIEGGPSVDVERIPTNRWFLARLGTHAEHRPGRRKEGLSFTEPPGNGPVHSLAFGRFSVN